MSDVIVTTTGTVDGYRIVQYFRPVVTNVVVGTGLVSDVIAGFSDVFGGRSQTYQAHLSDMYAQAVEELERKATQLGANCVVGARFDLDEISGKGMQMFMLNAVATPVVIKTDEEIAHQAAAAAEAKEEQARQEAERRERFAGATSLTALLNDPQIAEEARALRRMYGRSAYLGYVRRKAVEMGLGDIDLSVDDLPDTF